MTAGVTAKYRNRLLAMARRLQTTVAAVEEEACQPTGGEAGGGLSNAPLHLGDVGSAAGDQEVAATLLENEQHLLDEVRAALDRTDAGTFGRCEGCSRAIVRKRLDAIPYARYCAACATARPADKSVTVDDGRPRSWEAGIGLRAAEPPVAPEPEANDPHAAGTPGGGTAIGGLAGTTVGTGDPEDIRLDGALGSGAFDAAIEAEESLEEQETGYAGRSGGAVGGTPANKRVTGGRFDHLRG